MPRIPTRLLVLLSVAACGGPSGNDPFGTNSATISTTQPSTTTPATSETTADSGTTNGGASQSSTGADNTGAGSADTSSSTSDSPIFDVGVGGSTGETAPCVKVDVILAVDASSSMDGVIQALQASFNGWVGSLLADVGDGGIQDFQLAVIDGCDMSPFFHDTHDANGTCAFSTGANYMVSSSPNLGAEFTCVSDTQVSNYGAIADLCTGDEDDESPANAAAAAVTFPAEMNENAGFLRPDAVLFVIAVTNEDEGGSPSFINPQALHDALLAAKNNEVNNVVFLGIAGADICLAYGAFTTPAPQMESLAGLFAADNRGVFHDLCGQNIGPAFDMAIQLVDSACDNFVPEG